MILNPHTILLLSFIVLVIFVYKASAKHILLFLDNKIKNIKHSFENIDNLQISSQAEVIKIYNECQNLESDANFILNHCDKEINDIFETFEDEISNYQKELKQKADFITIQKKEVILKNFRIKASKTIEKIILKHISPSFNSCDIKNLISTLTNKLK